MMWTVMYKGRVIAAYESLQGARMHYGMVASADNWDNLYVRREW
jgi:hypothetical protein